MFEEFQRLRFPLEPAFEELQRLSFLIEPYSSQAKRFDGFIRICPGLPQSVELQPVASSSVRLELDRVFLSIRRGRMSPTEGVVEVLGPMGNHRRNVMDAGFIEDTDSLDRVPIQAAGSNGSFKVTKVVGDPEPDSRHGMIPAFDDRLELLEMNRHDIQAGPVAGPGFEPCEEAHGNLVRRP